MPSRPFRWNEVAGRYITSDGRFVTFARVRGYLDAALDSSERSVITLSQQLRAGQLSLPQWQIAMRDAIKDVHLASAALAKGGWAQMTQADYGRVGLRLKEQYAYLSTFAQEIERGLPLDGRFLNRVRLYAQSGRLTYHMVLRAEQAIRGATEERNILGGHDHCSECVGETEKGWVPIGELELIGNRICRSNCRCTLAYR